MNIRYALLGLLSREHCSGYDLKKKITDSSALYWSGNNNQIYTSLLTLRDEGLVEYQIVLTSDLPAKKIYSITQAGLEELKKWLSSPSPLPELRNDFLIKLEWADWLDAQTLFELIKEYETEVRLQKLMEEEKARRVRRSQSGSQKRAYLSNMVARNLTMLYENELIWLQNLREGLTSINTLQKGNIDELPDS